MAEATLSLSRSGSGLGIGLWKEAWKITLDGAVVGEIAHQETVEVAVRPGRHSLRLGEGRHVSPERSFDVAPAEVVSFRCHSPRVWPQMAAALIKPDLWISLRRT
jgi:hypothetical protein